MINKILKRFNFFHIKQVREWTENSYRSGARSSFDGATSSNLYNSWTSTNQSGDNILRMDLATMRARSRELGRNNPLAKRAFSMIERKTVGRDGFILQARTKDNAGKLHKKDNDEIESKFKIWGKKGVCDVTGEYTFRDIQKLAMRHVAQDGEVLLRRLFFHKNEFGYALQLIEADHLDLMYNDSLPNGNKIKMGKEFDGFGKCVAYHLFTNHPGDTIFADYNYSKKIRIPAEEMIHLQLPVRISANRGLPFIHAAMNELNQLGGMSTAELIAARVAATSMGFITNEDGENTSVFADETENSDGTGRAIFAAEPGAFRELGPGQSIETYKPEHPNAIFEPFMKVITRYIASGLDVSYNSLANDLSDVNFSSLRAGEIEQRDVWHDLQRWMIDHLLQIIYEDFIKMAITTGALNFPMRLIDKYKNQIYWRARGFPSVDPRSESLANHLAIANRIKSPQRIIIEAGDDPEEVLDEIQRWHEMLKDRGIEAKVEADINKIVSETAKNDED